MAQNPKEPLNKYDYIVTAINKFNEYKLGQSTTLTWVDSNAEKTETMTIPQKPKLTKLDIQERARKYFSWMFRDTYPTIAKFIQFLQEACSDTINDPCVGIVGGFIRDTLIFHEDHTPKDIDIVVPYVIRPETIKVLEKEFGKVKITALGGCKIELDGIGVDFWSVYSMSNFLKHAVNDQYPFFNTYCNAMFYNLDSVCLKLNINKPAEAILYENSFVESIDKKRISIIDASQLKYAHLALKGAYMAEKYKFSLGAGAAIFINKYKQENANFDQLVTTYGQLSGGSFEKMSESMDIQLKAVYSDEMAKDMMNFHTYPGVW